MVDLDWFELAMANERKPNISDYSFLVKKKKADAKKRHVKKQAKGLREGVGHVNTSKFAMKFGKISGGERKGFDNARSRHVPPIQGQRLFRV